MKILVIGDGNYLGKVFATLASNDNVVYFLNQNTNRCNVDWVKSISGDYDIVVDFGAYNKNDIKAILDNISTNIKKYIFVSTCDVYERNSFIKFEDSNFDRNTDLLPINKRNYVEGKILLEDELIENGIKKNINYVSVRPGLMYGPFNYLYNESLYFDSIIKNHLALFPDDANTNFEIVYVYDVAEAILKICESNNYNAYNICSNELLNYKRLSRYLRKFVDEDYKDIFLPYNEILEMGIELPYPIYKGEEMLCNSMRFKSEYKYKFTPTIAGLEKTYKTLKNAKKR